VPAVFLRRFDSEWAPSVPPLLRRGRFLVFAHALLAHADPYGVLEPRADALDVLGSLARCACVRLDVAALLLRAAVDSGLVRSSADRLTLASPYAPDSAAIDLLAVHGDASLPLSAPHSAECDAAPAAPQDWQPTGRTAIHPPTEGPADDH
jgi:hypothetical protein